MLDMLVFGGVNHWFQKSCWSFETLEFLRRPPQTLNKHFDLRICTSQICKDFWLPFVCTVSGVCRCVGIKEGIFFM